MPQNWDKRRIETPEDRCPECGGQVNGGRGGCQALFDEITFAAQDDLRVAALHRLAVDVYAMQHVESYCESAKSYAAHLISLWWGVNHLDYPAPVAPVLGILNGNIKLIKPPVLENRGSITLPDVMTHYRAGGDVDELVGDLRAWALDVWAAYADQESFVQAWLKL